MEEKQTSSKPKYNGREGLGHRMLLGTSIATGLGGALGLIGGASKGIPFKVYALPVTVNFAIAGSVFCAMTELTREMLLTDPSNPLNPIGGGLISGTTLARFQGNAKPFAVGILFALVGTGFHLAGTSWEAYRLKRFVNNLPGEAFPEGFLESREARLEEIERESDKSWPEWLPFRKISKEELEHKREIARRMREASRIEE